MEIDMTTMCNVEVTCTLGNSLPQLLVCRAKMAALGEYLLTKGLKDEWAVELTRWKFPFAVMLVITGKPFLLTARKKITFVQNQRRL